MAGRYSAISKARVRPAALPSQPTPRPGTQSGLAAHGDEFAVIQHGTKSPSDAMLVAGRICELLAEPFQLGALQVKVSASIGIAIGGVDGATSNSLLRLADMALYGAKAGGRGSYCFYSEELNAKAQARGELETGLTNALKNNELLVYYQPIVSAVTGEVTSFEALLRWQHPERGLVSPVDFIPLAEETGLIIPIGEWIFEQACADLARCPKHLTVSVNCSPVQVNSPRLVNSVKNALQKSGLPGERLRIEITESSLMNENSQVVARLEELRALGVKISIDDFGTGFSCLSYLQRYPVDCIKIDRSFVSRMGGEQDSTPIVVAIVGLATGLKMTTVAEGVETAAQLRELAAMGCIEAQGYLFSPPRPAKDILPLSNKLRDAA
ncbi:MAG: bifunctional diguanylate cyclase/phosphodiesterase [Hyphomicrobiales bacterium]|nr:bifunctional diguanylate cyclase/phosphodiesterase [Hyphomicrobiales bacterium]